MTQQSENIHFINTYKTCTQLLFQCKVVKTKLTTSNINFKLNTSWLAQYYRVIYNLSSQLKVKRSILLLLTTI